MCEFEMDCKKSFLLPLKSKLLLLAVTTYRRKYGCFNTFFGNVVILLNSSYQSKATILDKSPWDSTAIFLFSCYCSVPS